jgi:putative protease
MTKTRSNQSSPAAFPSEPELLSPAGSLEAFFAAMESGADAVYCGLKDFSARAKAKNFTLVEVAGMMAFAHGKGRRIYVTLNTLIKERELPALAETLSHLEALRVDGIILQDLAVWRLAREHFPDLELHSSTQMTVHNIAGVRMLERMGFKRAVLARELSLEEIRDLRSQTEMELEHFVHGALCFSFSGQCYFSSWLGGKSGNRGRCAQPCRRRYRYRQQEGYYFSTNDLSAIDLLPELADAGVTSLKIEGRMKSAEYVANVVTAYRRVLDASASHRAETIREAKELLKLSFGRLPTRGFLAGNNPTDIATPSIKGSTGRFLGEVATERDGTLSFKTRDRIHLGDRLRIQPKSDRAGTAFTIKELFCGRRPVKSAPAGSFVQVPSPFRGVFKGGDAVFKVSSEQAFTLSEASCRRRLRSAASSPEPVSIRMTLAGGNLRVQAETEGTVFERTFPVETFPAQESPLSAETLRGVFSRTGGEPFYLDALEAADLPPVVIPPSRLKEIRRDFYGDLRRRVAEGKAIRRRQHLQAALDALVPVGPVPRPERRGVTVAVGHLRDAHVLNDPEIDRVMVPVTPGNLQGLGPLGRRLANRPECVVWDLPFIIYDSDWGFYRDAVCSLARQGFSVFRLNNLGHFPLFDRLEGVRLETGYRLFSLNTQALLAWRELGAQAATLYIEDDRDNLAELLRREVGIGRAITVYASVPLITSRIRIRGVRADSPVLSDQGDAYRVDSRSGLTVVSADKDFSLLGHLSELQAMGCGDFTVDLSHLGPFSPAGRKVLEALKRDSVVPGASLFNFEGGMD